MKVNHTNAHGPGFVLKSAGLVLLGLLAALLLTVSVMLMLSDESDYPAMLAWSADHFLDSELVVSGPLSVGYSEGVTLSLESLHISAHDGSYSLTVNALDLRFQLAQVFSGVLWIDDLKLDDFILKIKDSGSDAQSGSDFPAIVVVSAQVEHLLVEYQEVAPGTLHRFALDNFVIDDADADGAADVHASGVFEEQKFELDGFLPALDTVHDAASTKPVSLEFSSEKINVRLKGTVTDPYSGAGLDLKLQASLQNLDEYLEIFGEGIPTLGRLTLSAKLVGDYALMRMEDIDLRLQRGEHVDLVVTGAVADIRTGEGAKLQIAGESDNPAVLSWLLFKEQDRISSISMKAVLEIEQSRYFISGLDVKATTPEGLAIFLGGAGEIFSAAHKIDSHDAGFVVKIEAPKTSIFKIMGRGNFPDLGPVSGEARMAIGLGAIGLYDTDFSFGRRQGSHVSLQGDIGAVPLNGSDAFAGTNLQAYITTTNLSRLGKQLGYTWPDLERAELLGDVAIQESELRLDNARLTVGDPRQPIIKASGSLATVLNRGSSLDLDFDVAATELVAAISDRKPAALGHIHGRTRISNMDGSWGIENIELVSSDTKIYQLDMRGKYDDLEHFDQGTLKADISITNLAELGLPESGAFRATGVLLGNRGKLDYKGSASLGDSSGTVELEGILVKGKPQFTGKLVVPLLRLADIGLAANNAIRVGQEARTASEGDHLFSREPMDTAYLNKFDLELDLSLDEVTGETLRIDSVDGHVSIRDGHLSIDPLQLNFEGGHSDIVFDVQDAALPEYKISIASNGVELGALFSQMDNEVALRGSSSLHADVKSSGHSLHELASGLSGEFSFGLENARIPREYVNLLSADVFGWVTSKSLAREKYADLNCIVMSFDSHEGNVVSRAIIAEGPALSIDGRISIDLENETLDVVLLPKQKKRLFSSLDPIKITGPIKAPKVKAIPAKAALKEIGTMALLPGVALSVKLVEKIWSYLDDESVAGGGCPALDDINAAVKKQAGDVAN